MKFKLGQLFTLIFSAFGLVVMLWSAWHWFQLQSGGLEEPSFCNINAYWNCDRASTSEYGSVFGIPIGIFGAAYFLLLGVLSITEGVSRKLLAALVIPSWLICGFLAYVLIVELQAGCIICFMGYAAALGAGVGVSLHKESVFEIGRLPAGISVAVAWVFLAFFALNQSRNAQPKIDDAELAKFKKYFAQIPVEEIPDVSPFKKGAEAPEVTVVEFSDFGCPFCARAASSLVPQLLREPGVQVVFFPFPLDSTCNKELPRQVHPGSCDWSRVSICSQKIGKFWPVHDEVFKRVLNEGKLPRRDKVLKDLGINPEELKACIDSEETEQKLQELIKTARDLKITSTPTFFVNGRRLKGYYEMPLFKILINEARTLK